MTKVRNRSPLGRGAHAIYAFFYNKKVGVIVILAMAAAALLGTLMPQADADVWADPEARAQFLAAMRDHYGGWTTPLALIGAFRMYSSALFLTLSAILTLSIAACTTHRLPQLWRKATRPRTRVSDRFFTRAHYRAQIPTDADPDAARQAVRATLSRAHYRVIDAEDDGPPALFADRFRFGPFGTVLAHAAFIIIIAALTVSNLTGVDKTLTLPVGTSQPVGEGTPYVLHARSFTDSYDASGRPKDYVSHIVLQDDKGQILADQEVRVNTPLRYDGYKFHQASYGFVAIVTVAGPKQQARTENVALTSVSRDGLYQYGVIDLPGKAGLKLIVATPASGRQVPDLAPGQALVRLLGPGGDGDLIAEATLDTGKTQMVGDYAVTFDREAPYTALTVRYDPGAPAMLVGSLLLLIGMSVTFVLRHRRVWVQVTSPTAADAPAPTLVQIASVDTSDSTYERHFASLVADIHSQVNPSAPPLTPSSERETRA